MNLKPQLAKDYDEDKLVFPLGIQPKIDGVRAWNPDGTLLGRSMKTHRNPHATAFFSCPEYVGLDGEMAAEKETHRKLCTLTSSALSRGYGEPFLLWHVFDLLNEDTVELGYLFRYNALTEYVTRMQKAGFCGHLRIVPMQVVNNLAELQFWEDKWLEEGYEGVIIRNLEAPYKEGRSTIKGAHLLRIKRFVEEEFIVKRIIEGERNDNVAQINELGKTFRTSHQENKVPNGMVGSMIGEILKDSELFKKGQVITVSKGDMTDDEAAYFFANPQKLLEQICIFKHFPKGVKDKPRFPTWKSIRSKEDL